MSILYAGVFITMATVIFVRWLERQSSIFIKRLLDWFPAILFAYVIPALMTGISGLDFSTIELHNWSRDLIMPMAILTVMSALSFSQLKMIGLKPIILFVTGSFVIAITPFLLTIICKWFNPNLFDLIIHQEYWLGLVTVVGSWIGGSTSQLVLKEITSCPDQLFITILVMDNVLVNIWTLFMFQYIKRSDSLNRFFRISDRVIDLIPDIVLSGEKAQRSATLTGSCCCAVVLLSYFVIDHFLVKVLLLSFAGILLGNFVKFWNHSWVLRIGGMLILIVMAILGLKLNFQSFNLPFSLVLFSIVWLVMHFLAMLAMAFIIKLNFAWIAIASMANVGGISTAPAVTAAYNEEWMPYAVILAILSMVSGTTWGLVTIWLFGLL